MDIDAQYPELSALAKSKGKTLRQLAGEAQAHDRLLEFRDCCDLVRMGAIGSGAPEHHNYLATLNEFTKQLHSDSRAFRSIWRKLLMKSTATQSQFLDTVVEAAWALSFWERGLVPDLEQPFQEDLSQPKPPGQSKNADFLLTRDGIDIWLEAYSVQLPRRDTSHSLFVPSTEELAVTLAEKAKNKYKKDFRRAINEGGLRDCKVGVLLCVIKSGPIAHPPLWLKSFDKVATPPGLFDGTTPGLEVVCVHDLQARPGSDILQPVVLGKWSRPSSEINWWPFLANEPKYV
jgi:hypothetical protein